MKPNETVMFQQLELNQRMMQAQQEPEKKLFRYIRQNYAMHILSNPDNFPQVVRDISSRIDRINASRIGRGGYLHLDAAMPTDCSVGWLKITYLTVPRAQARITITNVAGEIESKC